MVYTRGYFQLCAATLQQRRDTAKTVSQESVNAGHGRVNPTLLGDSYQLEAFGDLAFVRVVRKLSLENGRAPA